MNTGEVVSSAIHKRRHTLLRVHIHIRVHICIYKGNLLCMSSCRVLFSIRRHLARITAWWIALKAAAAVPSTWMPSGLVPEFSSFPNNFGVINMSEASWFSDGCIFFLPILESHVLEPGLSEGQLPPLLDEVGFAISIICAFGSTFREKWYVKLISNFDTKKTEITKFLLNAFSIYLMYSTEAKNTCQRKLKTSCCFSWFKMYPAPQRKLSYLN